MLSQISLGLQLVHSSGLCWGQTVLQKDCYYCRQSASSVGVVTLKQRQRLQRESRHINLLPNKHKNRVELFLYFIFTVFGHRGDVVSKVWEKWLNGRRVKQTLEVLKSSIYRLVFWVVLPVGMSQEELAEWWLGPEGVLERAGAWEPEPAAKKQI